MTLPSKPRTCSFYRRWALILSAVNSNLEGLNIMSLSLTPVSSPMTSCPFLLSCFYAKCPWCFLCDTTVLISNSPAALRTHFWAHRPHSFTGSPCQVVSLQSLSTQALGTRYYWAALSTTDPSLHTPLQTFLLIATLWFDLSEQKDYFTFARTH